MATQSFRFWDSYTEALDLLTDEQAGRLVKALGHYVFRGEEPEIEDVMMRVVFTVMSSQAEQSRDISARAAERGRMGGRPRKSSAKSTALSGAKSSAKSSAKSTALSGAKAKRKEAKRSEASLSLRESFAAPLPGATASGPGAGGARENPYRYSDVPPAEPPEGAVVGPGGIVELAPPGAS